MSHLTISSRDFVVELYRVTKSPYATAHVAIATNRVTKTVSSDL